MRFDLHTHTTFSDGKNTPEEMILAAIDRGLDVIGISDHSYTSIDESYCLPKENVGAYRAEVRRLKEKYRGKIRVLLGIEEDYFADEEPVDYDYSIGSVHYLFAGGEYVPVDESPATLRDLAARHFGGDMLAVCEAYYETVGDVIRKTGADVIGHFDLIRKFNRDGALFDESDPRYIAAARRAIDRLLPFGVPFEVNTGAVSRGYLCDPYPKDDLIAYIRKKGGRFILSSDSHRTDTIAFGFGAYDLPIADLPFLTKE